MKLIGKLKEYFAENQKYLKRIAIQFIKFGIVGFLNTLLYFIIYYSLLLLNIHYLFANSIAFILNVLNAYYWGKKYVFDKPKKGKQESLFRLIKVFSVYFLTFLLGFVFLFIEVNYLGISEKVGPIMNICVTVPLNFLLNKFWAMK